MPHQNRPLARAAVVAAALLAGAVPGCKDQPGAVPATAPAAAGVATADLNGVTFEYPSDWKVTRSPDGKAINISGPRDGDWEPNVNFQVQETKADKAIDEELAENAALLAASKDDYRLRNSGVIDHASGAKVARIEYVNTVATSDGGKVALQQWSILMPLKKGTRLQVQASADGDVWSRHQPMFEKIVESIRIPK